MSRSLVFLKKKILFLFLFFTFAKRPFNYYPLLAGYSVSAKPFWERRGEAILWLGRLLHHYKVLHHLLHHCKVLTLFSYTIARSYIFSLIQHCKVVNVYHLLHHCKVLYRLYHNGVRCKGLIQHPKALYEISRMIFFFKVMVRSSPVPATMRSFTESTST